MVADGRRKAAYAVVADSATPEARRLPDGTTSQKAELMALTRGKMRVPHNQCCTDPQLVTGFIAAQGGCRHTLQGHRAQHDAVSRGNARADTAARSLTNTKSPSTPVPFLTTATQPACSPSEKQALLLKGGIESKQGWIFLKDQIARPRKFLLKSILTSRAKGFIPRCVAPFSPGLQQTVDQDFAPGGFRPQFPTHQMHGNLPAQDWQIDFTHMPTHTKLRYLLTSVDTFAGWTEAFPLPGDSGHVGQWSSIYSPSDQLLAKSLNISRKLHVPYHPQSSGKVERAHGILKDRLAKLAIDVKLSWPTLLPLALARPGPPRGDQRALAPLHCGTAGLSWLPMTSLHNRPPRPPTFPLSPPPLAQGTRRSRSPCRFGTGGPHPAAPLQPGDSVLLRELKPGSLQPRWMGLAVILTTPTAAELRGHTPWCHVSRLKLPPQSDQCRSEPPGPSLPPPDPRSLLLTALLILPLEANSYVWRFYIQESWAGGPTTKTHDITQADGQPAGVSLRCSSLPRKEKVLFSDTERATGREEATFFMDCVFSVTSCMATASGATPPTAGVPITPVKFTGHNPALVNNQLRTLLQNRALIPNIRDPRNECWNAGVTAKLNVDRTYRHPQGTWLSSGPTPALSLKV
ncbi:Gag-Pol polyprotein [Plecturocebus cupreus]